MSTSSASNRRLPPDVQRLARKNYRLLEADPYHPPLHFKKIGRLWFVRIGQDYRALALNRPDGIYWFWIGPHGEYDRLIG